MIKFDILLFRRSNLTINICNRNALCGSQAARALDAYIQTLETGKIEGLTEKQVYSLIKTAKVIRTAVVQSNNR